MKINSFDQLATVSFQPCSHILIDGYIFWLRKGTPFTIEVFAPQIVPPMPGIHAVGVDKRINKNANLAPKPLR